MEVISIEQPSSHSEININTWQCPPWRSPGFKAEVESPDAKLAPSALPRT